MTAESDFLKFLSQHSIAPRNHTIIADDKIHRYEIEGGKVKRMNGAYQLRVDSDGFACGWAKDWGGSGERIAYTSKEKRSWSAEDKAAYRARREAAEQARAEQAALDAVKIREKAARLWAGSDKRGASEYLTRKQIISGPARFWRGGVLVVPVNNPDRELVGLQIIAPDGSKRFLSGSETKGGYCAFKGDESVIYLAEGYCTAGSVWMATGNMTICAFNAGNLVPVAEWVRARFPDARIVIAADNDGDE